MRALIVIVGLLVATPSHAFFNSYTSGYLLGVCVGLNPMCWVGKSNHDMMVEQQRKEAEQKEREKNENPQRVHIP